MNDRRIIFLNRVYWPSTAATAQLLTDLAEGLAARGWDVHVIAAGDNPEVRNGVTIHRTGPGDHHRGLISRVLNYHRFQRAATRQLAAIARRGDHVVPMTDPPLLVARLAPLADRLGLQVHPWIQDIYPEIAAVHFGPLAGLLLSPLRWWRNRAWRQATSCVTLGEDMARAVTDGGIPRDRITLIPNWAPRELDAPVSADAIAERRRAWDAEGCFIIAYSGNLGRVHEFDTVLNAAARLRHRPGILFLFIGQGARFNAVAKAVRERKLPNVRLLPPEPRERLPAALAAADVHLVTLQPAYGSLVFPSKLAGVLAVGRPVVFVGPVNGDIGRLIARTGCGAAVAPGDRTALVERIALWQADPERARVDGAAARAAYESQFTYATALAAWDTLLRRADSAREDPIALDRGDSVL